MHRTKRLVAASLAALCGAVPVAAQQHQLQGAYVLPAGEFAEYSGAGFGLDYAFLHPFRGSSLVSVRAEAGFMTFVPVADRVCIFSETGGCRQYVDVTSTRSLLHGTVGPQLTIRRGPLQPYVHAGAGLSLFHNRSPALAGAEQLSSVGVDWTAGGGLSYLFGDSPLRDMSLVIGARYHGGTKVKYAPRGELAGEPDEAVRYTPASGARDVFVIGAGVVVEF